METATEFSIIFKRNDANMFDVTCKCGNKELTSTFDGLEEGFTILQTNIAEAIRDKSFIPGPIQQNLNKLGGIFYNEKGSSLGADDQGFIKLFETFKTFITENKAPFDSNQLFVASTTFVNDSKNWYNELKKSKPSADASISRLANYFKNNTKDRDTLNEYFSVEGTSIGKGKSFHLDPVFKPLFPSRFGFGGSRKTLKKYT